MVVGGVVRVVVAWGDEAKAKPDEKSSRAKPASSQSVMEPLCLPLLLLSTPLPPTRFACLAATPRPAVPPPLPACLPACLPARAECDGWCDYPVADRPNAVRQFLEAAQRDPSMIKGPWLLVIETDFVFIKPIQAPLAESDAPGQAFKYGYIQPLYPTVQVRGGAVWCGGGAAALPPCTPQELLVHRLRPTGSPAVPPTLPLGHTTPSPTPPPHPTHLPPLPHRRA